MKVKDIIKKINDYKLYVEIKDRKTGASYGFYTKSDLIKYISNSKSCQTKMISYFENVNS